MSSNQLLDQIRARQQNKTPSQIAPSALELMETMIGKSLTPIARQQADAFGLLRGDDGSLRFDDVQLTSVGLVIPADGISQDTASHLLDMLLRLEGSIQWLIGDVLAYGQRVYGESYQAMAVAFGRDYQTIADYKWVASNVDFSLRNEKLTFNHHRMVAGFDVTGQAMWLDCAAEMKWSIAKMRAFISLLDVFDVEVQRDWLKIVQEEGLTADALRARLGAAGGNALAVVEHGRDLVGKMTTAKRLVNTIEKYGADLTGASVDMVRDVVKSARAMRALADELLSKHGGGR